MLSYRYTFFKIIFHELVSNVLKYQDFANRFRGFDILKHFKLIIIMRNLLFVITAFTFVLASCKKEAVEPKNIDNHPTIIIIYPGGNDTATTPVVPVTPTIPVVGSLIDSSTISTSNDTSNGVWATNAVGVVRTLGSSEMPSFPYGANTVGVEFRIEFTIMVNRQIDFSSDQSLQITPITTDQVGTSKNIEIIASGSNWARIKMSTKVLRNSTSADVSTRAYVENFYYTINSIPHAALINLSTPSRSF